MKCSRWCIWKNLRKESPASYPEGKTNSLAKALAHKTGYKSAYTLEPGPVRFFTNPYQINRNVVSGNDTLVDFKNKLALFVRKDLK